LLVVAVVKPLAVETERIVVAEQLCLHDAEGLPDVLRCVVGLDDDKVLVFRRRAAIS